MFLHTTYIDTCVPTHLTYIDTCVPIHITYIDTCSYAQHTSTHNICTMLCQRGAYNPLPNDKYFNWSKLKAFADNKMNIIKNSNSSWDG